MYVLLSYHKKVFPSRFVSFRSAPLLWWGGVGWGGMVGKRKRGGDINYNT